MPPPVGLGASNPVTLPMRNLFLFVILACALASAQSIVPTTTLHAETVNNTSAPDGFRSQPNGNAPAGNISKLPIASLLYDGANTRIWVRYMPWFGDKGHIDIGYRSTDRAQVRRQVADMISRGITGAIVDWYGPHQDFKNKSTQLLMGEAEAQGLQFALSYDKGSLKECEKRSDCDRTAQMIADLRYAFNAFEQSPAYMRINGRPALFFFGLEKSSIDWQRLRSSLPSRPLFFFRNSGAFRNSDDDGGYSWVAPEAVKPGDPMSTEYLQRFYDAARDNAQKYVVGSAYKGFNDSLAGWGKGRVIDQQCGDTWLRTFGTAGRFFSRKNQLPDLLVVTWNDYEEGTEIESGIENCIAVSARLNGGNLRWDVKGSDTTLDHFTIFVSANGKDLMTLGDVPARARSFDLAPLGLPRGDYFLYLKAVGRASFTNHMSQPVQYSLR